MGVKLACISGFLMVYSAMYYEYASNAQQPTPNIQVENWELDVGCWALRTFLA